MRNLVSEYVSQFRQDRQKQIKLGVVLAALAVLVAGIVFWQLHNTGVAMTNEVFCGQEEHTHDENCYESVLVCGLEESEGTEGHTHTDACMDENGNIVCGLDESKLTEGHVHTDACYESVLICDIPEHIHTVECLIDETADVETLAEWEDTLPELTGLWTEDIVSIAESQIGYTESERNFQLSEDGETHQGYTRYGAWYGNEYGDWDAMFVSFCLNYAGVPNDVMPESSGAYALSAALDNMDLYVNTLTFTSSTGDLVFFDTDEDGHADRVGVISAAGEDELTVIEGNFEDTVAENVYSANDQSIVGFGILPEQPGLDGLAFQTLNANISEANVSDDIESADSEITLTGLMPEGASVNACPVDVQLNDVAVVDAYDITIYDAGGEEYQPTAGSIRVTISSDEITNAQNSGNADLHVWHMEDKYTDPEEISNVNAVRNGVEFSANSFSIYVVVDGTYEDIETGFESTVYTVNFYEYVWDENIDEQVPVSTQCVMGGDMVEKPATPEESHHVFNGWFTTRQDSTTGEQSGYQYDFDKTVLENLIEWGSDYQIESGNVINLYSDYDPVYYVYFMSAENQTESPYVFLTSEYYEINSILDTSDATNMYNTAYGNATGQVVTGWYYYSNGRTVTVNSNFRITNDLVLYPILEDVVWIYFDMGDEFYGNSGASEAELPTYVFRTETTLGGAYPSDPVCSGYSFKGWYTDEKYTTEVTAGTELSSLPGYQSGAVTLYAKWEPQIVSYTINIWRQKATDGEEGLENKKVKDGEKYTDYVQYYDFYTSRSVDINDSQLKSGDTNINTASVYNWDEYIEQYEDRNGNQVFEYNKERTENNLSTITVAADGSTVINMFFDRRTINWHFYDESNNIDETLTGLWNTSLTWVTPPEGYRWQYNTADGGTYTVPFDTVFSWCTSSDPTNVEFHLTTSSVRGLAYFYFETADGSYALDEGLDGINISSTQGLHIYKGTFPNYESYGYYSTESEGQGVTDIDEAKSQGNWVDETNADNSTGFYLSPNSNQQSDHFYVYYSLASYNVDLYVGSTRISRTSYKYTQDIDMELPTELDPTDYGYSEWYVFEGWYSDPDCTSPFEMPDTMPGNNLVAYANWILKPVTVTFTSPYESNLYQALVAAYGSNNITDNDDGTYSVTLSATEALTNIGEEPSGLTAYGGNYLFAGWKNADTGSLFNFFLPLYDDVTIEAVWVSTSNNYTLTYDINDVSYSGKSTYCDDVGHSLDGAGEYALSVENAFNLANTGADLTDTQIGKFICWNTNPEGNGTSFYPDDEINFSELVPNIDGNNNITLYAQWAEEKTASLVLDYNYPSGYTRQEPDENPTASTLISGSNLENIILADASELNSTIIIIDGQKYVFAGWSTDPNAEVAMVGPDSTVAVDNLGDGENILYAVWEAAEPWCVNIFKFTEIDTPLSGAEFTITDASTGKTACFDENYDFVYWLYDGEEAPYGYTTTVISGDNGLIDLGNMYAGEYILTETKAPEGYVILEEPIGFVVGDDGTVYDSDGYPVADYTISVENESSSQAFDIFKYTLTGEGYESEETPLAGAKFILTDGNGNTAYFTEDNGTYALEGWLASGEYCPDGYTSTITTGDDGYAHVKGVSVGQYWLTETKAPDGYMLLTEPTEITVTANISDLVVKIENISGRELPNTGGAGTWIFYVAGAVMITGATIVLYQKRRAVRS